MAPQGVGGHSGRCLYYTDLGASNIYTTYSSRSTLYTSRENSIELLEGNRQKNNTSTGRSHAKRPALGRRVNSAILYALPLMLTSRPRKQDTGTDMRQTIAKCARKLYLVDHGMHAIHRRLRLRHWTAQPRTAQ